MSSALAFSVAASCEHSQKSAPAKVGTGQPTGTRGTSETSTDISGYIHSVCLRNKEITVCCDSLAGTESARREGHTILGCITDAVFENRTTATRDALGALRAYNYRTRGFCVQWVQHKRRMPVDFHSTTAQGRTTFAVLISEYRDLK